MKEGGNQNSSLKPIRKYPSILTPEFSLLASLNEKIKRTQIQLPSLVDLSKQSQKVQSLRIGKKRNEAKLNNFFTSTDLISWTLKCKTNPKYCIFTAKTRIVRKTKPIAFSETGACPELFSGYLGGKKRNEAKRLVVPASYCHPGHRSGVGYSLSKQSHCNAITLFLIQNQLDFV
jgi:hypothetical protein